MGIWPDKQSYTVNCEGRTFIRSRQMLRANKQIEVNVTASPEQSTSPSKCVNPKTLPPGLPKIPGNLRQTTTGLSINRQELRSCSLIGPPSAPGCPPSSSSSSSWCSYTSVTGVTKGQTRRQDGQSSTSSLCLRPGTVPIAARNQSRLPWNTPPRFTCRHQRPSQTPCTPSSPTLSQAPFCQEDQLSPLHRCSHLMECNFPELDSPASTTLNSCPLPTSEMSVGLPASVRSAVPLLHRDSAVSRIPPVIPPLVLSRNPSSDNQVCLDSHLPDQDMGPPFLLHQMCKTEFPPLGASEPAQNAFIKKNEKEQNKINTKKTRTVYSPSKFVFQSISRRSKF